jgi:ribonuclease E
MQEITEQPTTASEATDGLAAAALRAEAWAGEPFLREGEDPAQVLAPGTSRRRALDDALAEIEAGRRTPTPAWKVEYGLMLGLERVLAEERPHLASGTELRRHQVDALAGMLTELIASHEREAGPNGNGNGNGAVAEAVEEDEPMEDSTEDVLDEEHGVEEDEEFTGPDPGAVRRYRFRHPTASGKTIAAAGFVEAARTLGVLILTHRRLLVAQFQRDLTDEGYGDRFSPAI